MVTMAVVVVRLRWRWLLLWSRWQGGGVGGGYSSGNSVRAVAAEAVAAAAEAGAAAAAAAAAVVAADDGSGGGSGSDRSMPTGMSSVRKLGPMALNCSLEMYYQLGRRCKPLRKDRVQRVIEFMSWWLRLRWQWVLS